MDVGLYSDSLSTFPLGQALDIAADAGIRSIEIAVGGQSRAPHLRVDDLLGDAKNLAAFRDAFQDRGQRIAALNCSAWPLHPRDGAFHDQIIDKTLRLAGELGVTKVVSMSGCAGDGPTATTVNWVWYPWPDDAVDFAQRAWDGAVEFWQRKARLAEACGVEKIALELHPLHVVYNVPTMLAFRERVGPRIGMNVDPSHLIWQQMDPVAVVRAVGNATYHVHMKDTRVDPEQVAIAGVLDNRPFTDPAKRAWVFRTVGRAHDAAWWGDFIDALAEAGYDDTLSIEQEDPYAPQEEGVREAAAFTSALIAARDARFAS